MAERHRDPHAHRRITAVEARQKHLGEGLVAAGGRSGKRARALEEDVALLVQLNRALLRLLVARGTVTLEEVRAEMARESDGDITGEDLRLEFGLPAAAVDPARRFSAGAKRKRPRFE